MGIILRLEKESDYKIVENVTREVFWNVYKPGCNEHLILHVDDEELEFYDKAFPPKKKEITDTQL